MRDRRFVAAHRGGPLGLDTHRLLAAWAARCAEHVVHFCPDARAQRAIEAAKMWAKGRISVGDARRAAIAAHAAARESRSDAARAAARAAGHAAATAHMADHSLGPALYGVKAAEAGTGSGKAERSWQLRRLPPAIRPFVVSALEQRVTRR